jgi:hypothetical protein
MHAVSDLLKPDQYELVRVAAAESLLRQKNWSKDIWNEIPAALQAKGTKNSYKVRAATAWALQGQSQWPSTVWNIVPALLADDESDPFGMGDDSASRHIALALTNQTEWPENVWLKVEELMATGKRASGELVSVLLQSRPRLPEFIAKKMDIFFLSQKDNQNIVDDLRARHGVQLQANDLRSSHCGELLTPDLSKD